MSATSHDFADNLIRLGEWIKTKPAFPLSEHWSKADPRIMFSRREDFLFAVRACGSGKKGDGITTHYFRFTPNTPDGTELQLEIDRDSICKLIEPARPAVYACDPLLENESEVA